MDDKKKRGVWWWLKRLLLGLAILILVLLFAGFVYQTTRFLLSFIHFASRYERRMK